MMIRWLAIVDNLNMISLFVDCIGYHMYNVPDEIWTKNSWGCKLGVYVVLVLQHYETWVVVAVTVERYMSIMHPIKAHAYLSRERLKLALWAILAICLLEYLPQITSYDVIENWVEWPCEPSDVFGRWWEYNYKPTGNLIFWVFGPFSIVLICNVIVIGKLLRMSKNHDSLGVSKEQAITQKKTKNMAPLLLSLSFVFLITQAPFQMFLTPQFGWKIYSADPTEQEYLILWFNIVYVFAYLNYSTNFFLYVLTNKKMRARFLAKFCKYRPACVPTPQKETPNSSKSTKSSNATVKCI